MGKKKDGRAIPFSGKKTLIEKLEQELLEHGNKKSTVINFLADRELPAQRLMREFPHPDQVPNAVQNNLADFFTYFQERYDLATADAREELWGDGDSTLLLFGRYYRQERRYKKQKKELEQLYPEIRSEAEHLAEKLMALPDTVYMTFFLPNVKGEDFCEEQYIDDMIRNNAALMERIHVFLVYDIAAMLLTGGELLADIETGEHIKRFGFYAEEDGTWQPLDPEQIRIADTMCDDGSFFDPEDDIEYIRLQR